MTFGQSTKLFPVSVRRYDRRCGRFGGDPKPRTTPIEEYEHLGNENEHLRNQCEHLGNKLRHLGNEFASFLKRIRIAAGCENFAVVVVSTCCGRDLLTRPHGRRNQNRRPSVGRMARSGDLAIARVLPTAVAWRRRIIVYLPSLSMIPPHRLSGGLRRRRWRVW
jgi:hypothetical protein